MRLFIALPILLLCTSCAHIASNTTKNDAEPWSETSKQIGVPREELVAIAATANQAHKMDNLVVVGMVKDKEENTIQVIMAKSQTAGGGLVYFYKKTTSGWVEDTNMFNWWDRVIPKVGVRTRM